MALSLLSSIVSSGTVGLASLLGNHNSAAQNAQTYLSVIMAASNSPQTVADEADLLATTLAATDPVSAALAKQLKTNAANPSMVLALCNQIAQNIANHNSNILSTLSAVVAGATGSGNTSLAQAASSALLGKALGA